MAVTRLPPPSLVIPGLFGGILAHFTGVPMVEAPEATAAAAVFSALGVVAVGWPLWMMSQAQTPPEPWKETTRLVTNGPYRFSRNPIYVGFLLLQAGVPLWFGMWVPLALVPLTWVLLDRLIVRKEEKYLAGRFEEYQDYLLATRRWL